MQNPVVTGVTARFQGSQQGTTTWYYWIQAIYPNGNAALSASANTGAKALAALTAGNFVNVQWNPAPGAIGYLVWRATSSTAPGTGGLLLVTLTSETGIKDDGTFSTTTTSPRFDGIYVAKCLYDFATDGGVTPIIPALSDTIPANAIVFGGLANSVIAATAVGAATIAIGTSAGSGAATILAATGKASFSLDAVLELGGVNSQAAGQKASFKMTAAGQIQLTIATGPLTAGRIEIFVFYVLATNA